MISIATVTILIGFVGVLATLFAPNLGRRARIFTEIERVETALPKTPAKDLSVEIYHNGSKISDPLAVASIIIENTGSLDVTADEFVAPIEIRFDPEARLVTAEIEAPDGTYATCDISNHAAQVKWVILKPKEQVKLRIAFSHTNSEGDLRQWDKKVRIIAKLKDVKNGEGWRSYFPIFASLVMGFFMAGALAASTLADDIGRHNAYIMSAINPNEPKILSIFTRRVTGTVRYYECEPQTSAFNIKNCRDIPRAAYQQRLRQAYIGTAYIGTTYGTFWAVIGAALFYALFSYPMFMRRPPSWLVRLLPDGLVRYLRRRRRSWTF